MELRQPPIRTGSREAQRSRTRRAIVEATRELLATAGAIPTVDAVADAAQVTRRTVYLHFPTLDQLLLDAALGALTEAYVGTSLEQASGPSPDGDVYARVDALVRAVLDLATTTLPLGRQIIKLTVDQPPGSRPAPGERVVTDGPTSGGTRRGHRRVRWIETALEPIAGRLTPAQHRRLVSGLSVVIGFEAMVVLRDIRGATADEEREVTLWAARTLVDAVLAEHPHP